MDLELESSFPMKSSWGEYVWKMKIIFLSEIVYYIAVFPA